MFTRRPRGGVVSVVSSRSRVGEREKRDRRDDDKMVRREMDHRRGLHSGETSGFIRVERNRRQSGERSIDVGRPVRGFTLRRVGFESNHLYCGEEPSDCEKHLREHGESALVFNRY